MNVLFLSLGKYKTINTHEIYTDLLREFIKNGHNVFIVSPKERRDYGTTEVIEEEHCKIINVKMLNIFKTNLIEKGLATLMVSSRYLNAINKYFKGVKFDLILYPTPPITLASVVSKLKKKYNCKTYLMLKDIFPQNSIDLGILKKKGIKGIIYSYFVKKEKKLYEISDKIGCMSQANIEYVIKHNNISRDKLEICPNAIEVVNVNSNDIEKLKIREKYNLPLDKKIFVYGGNLGKPQGIPFLIKCINSQRKNKDAFFLVVGDGTDYDLINEFYQHSKQSNFKLIKKMDKSEYDKMISSCDIGMIFLDYNFTIPNFPSRILSLMQAKLPILCCIDRNTDIGDVVENAGIGWKCYSNDVNEFGKKIELICKSDASIMGIKSYDFLKKNYSVEKCYEIIMKENKNYENINSI